GSCPARCSARSPGPPPDGRWGATLDCSGRGNARKAEAVTRMPRGPSSRGLVPPFLAMDMLRAASAREAAGHSVIHLEVGQPGTPAPQPVLEAARTAL